MISEVPLDPFNYKVPVQLFRPVINKLYESLFLLLYKKKCSLDIVLATIKNLKEDGLEKKDFRFLKVIYLLEESIDQWKEYSDSLVEVDLFDLKILFSSLEGNLPRNYMMANNKKNTNIFNLSQIDFIDPLKPTVYCIRGNYGSIKSSGSDYSPQVIAHLSSLGPVRRLGFEFEILKEKILKKIHSHDSLVLMGPNTLENDQGWSQVFEGQEFHEKKKCNSDSDFICPTVPFSPSFLKKKAHYDLVNYSQSKIQTYLDCPQKFWFHYILKYSPKVSFDDELSFLDLGNAEHLIVQKYLEQYRTYNEAKHIDLIKEILDKNFKEDQNLYKYHDYYNEFYSFTKETIRNLSEMRKVFKIEYEFEKPIGGKKSSVQGRMDVVGQSEKFLFIFDLKRSGSSIPTIKKIKDFSSIQLWFYLTHFPSVDSLNKKIVLGYINLSSFDKSLFISESRPSEGQISEARQELSFDMNVVEVPIKSKMAEYSKLEEELINKMKSDEDFSPKPKEEKTCEYCELSTLCPRQTPKVKE